MSLSTCNNSFYTRIQAFGTASAFDPPYITKAGSIGPPNGESCDSSSSSFPYHLINVDVDVSKVKTCDIIKLGNKIPYGCVIKDISMRSQCTLTDTMLSVSLGFGVAATGATGCFVDIPQVVYSSLDEQSSSSINGAVHQCYECNGTPNGEVEINMLETNLGHAQSCTNPMTPPPLIGGPVFPCLYINSATVTSPNLCCPCPPAIINAKIVYYCP